MASIQMAVPSGLGIGGVIQGNFGTYQQATDGTYTIDTRDASAMLVLGMIYVSVMTQAYTGALAPAAATIGAVVASTALSNGTLAITANPDIPRPVNVEVGTGTTAITAGTVAVTYVGNDGASGTDTLSISMALSTAVTQALSRGVVTISGITVAGVVGGTSPWIRLSTTAALSVPVGKAAVDVAFLREYDAGATVAVGTALTNVLASITPTNAPNGTRTYTFLYNYVNADA